MDRSLLDVTKELVAVLTRIANEGIKVTYPPIENSGTFAGIKHRVGVTTKCEIAINEFMHSPLAMREFRKRDIDPMFIKHGIDPRDSNQISKTLRALCRRGILKKSGIARGVKYEVARADGQSTDRQLDTR